MNDSEHLTDEQIIEQEKRFADIRAKASRIQKLMDELCTGSFKGMLVFGIIEEPITQTSLATSPNTSRMDACWLLEVAKTRMMANQ